MKCFALGFVSRLQLGADCNYSHNRNWRYHKKLRVWLTKDEMMVPQPLGNGTERGYYVFFDFQSWARERVRIPLS
jgi:CCR4-NOT transcriptional regulation complex NOT5 subunit